MRKALIVGIDYYEHASPLNGCVNDAHAMKAVLERNSDGTVNFDVKLLTGTGPADTVDRATLKDHVRQLFSQDGEIALLYFAGHGYIEETGGYLVCSDVITGDDGLALSEIQTLANQSRSRNKVFILDSCHSGMAGNRPDFPKVAELSDGVTILTASTAEQYASESENGGVFTNLLVDALNGAAGNLVGEVTPGSVYAHIDQSLGMWEGQRPVFKTNTQKFISLRRVQAPISLADLQRLTEFFPEPGFEFPLDPGYEPESENPDPSKTSVFQVLQRFNRVNLLVPIGAPHMYHAAMESRGCRLTVLGEHYRRIVAKGRI